MPKPPASLRLHAPVSLRVGDDVFGGTGRVALLAAVGACGSITQAARQVGMSYKAAWDAIDAMNNLAGEALVVRLTGGKGGGGTRLTPRGEALVANFQEVEHLHNDYIAQLNRRMGELTGELTLLQRLNMKTSARNQFFGRVTALRPGAVNDEVTLEIAGGNPLVAVVTHESTLNLGLQVGADAWALVKSSSVILLAGADDLRLSARNRLSGTVARVTPGAVNTEVALALPGGASIAALITRESAEALGLEEGSAATALFKASSVILGVPG